MQGPIGNWVMNLIDLLGQFYSKWTNFIFKFLNSSTVSLLHSEIELAVVTVDASSSGTRSTNALATALWYCHDIIDTNNSYYDRKTMIHYVWNCHHPSYTLTLNKDIANWSSVPNMSPQYLKKESIIGRIKVKCLWTWPFCQKMQTKIPCTYTWWLAA